MTVQDLIDELSQFDPDYEVVIDECYDIILEEDEDNEEILIKLGD